MISNNTQTVIIMFFFSLACIFLQINPASAQSNPFQDECHSLSTLNTNRLRLLAQNRNSFWPSTETRQVYLAALDEGSRGVKLFGKYHTITVADRAAIVLAAIVSHDLPLMEDNYGHKVDSYFAAKARSGPLYWAAVCNFYNGVEYLLQNGNSPNSNTDTHNAAFNVSLLYKKSKIPQLLLKKGYSISRNYRWCTSSKYILHRYRNRILDNVAAKIDGATCHQPIPN